MANWRSYIDPSVGDGQNTLNGIIANGPTYGIGISDDLSVTGLSTFSDIARFSSTIRLDGQLRDGDNNFGSSGQVLSSDGTDTRWVNAGSLSAGAASLVAINDDGNTDASRFITFVDSSSGNNALKTDSVIKYNPSTNILNLNATASGIKFGPGNATTDDAHIEWLGGNNSGYLRISTSDDNGSEYIQFGDYDGQGRSGTFTQWLRISRNTGTFTGTFSATTFSGSGASLTSLNASNISSGTINAARVPTLNQNTTGSAATLTTARTIGGVSFNGSANINLPGVNQAGNQNTSGNAGSATVLETTRNFSISGEITANAQSFNGSDNVTLSATVDDNVIDYNNLKASNRTTATNGQYLRKRSGNTGGMTWEDIPVVTGGNLTGNTLASGIVNSSLTSLGTLSSLTVDGTVSGTANISLTGGNHSKIECGRTSGSVAMTINDGYGNANLAFNHASGPPDINGSACRIETSVDSTTGSFNFEIGNSVTSGSAVTLTDTLYFTTSTITYKGNTMWHAGNDGPSSGLDADKLDNQEGSYYRNAGNLNAGTIPDARLANSSLFVTGMIMMYTGSTAPSGWAICNGQNGTPDLRDRFIVGAGSAYSVNNTGGANSVTLSTTQIPSHTHTKGTLSTNSDTHNHGINDPGHTHTMNFNQGNIISSGGAFGLKDSGTANRINSNNTGISINNDAHSHTVTGNTGGTGGGGSHENRPPYYALMFIMKL